MKRTIQGLLLTGALLVNGSALAQQAGKSQEAKKGTADVRGFVIPTDEKSFLERVHYINQTEIKLGQLARQNSTNPDVKSFGENMVREHTDADQKVMSLAQSRGLKLAEMPKPLNDVERKSLAADKAVMEELQVLKGEPFDSNYISNQVGAHDAALGKLMAGRQAITGNAQLTALIDELSQRVAQHRQQAYSVLGKLGQSMGVGGAGGGTPGSGMKGTEPGMGTGGMGTGGTGAGSTGGDMGGTSGTRQPKK